MVINYKELRLLIFEAFSAEELADFCFDNYGAVYRELSSAQSYGQQIRMLIDYARTRGQTVELVNRIAIERPVKYQQHEESLYSNSEQEFRKLAIQGRNAISHLNQLNIVIAKSRLLELEILDTMFGGMVFSADQVTRMQSYIEELNAILAELASEEHDPS
ncbi:MAG: hypothetical protein AAF614_14255 [Chloroflexota bacterium]